jgi:hypothetical protein
MVILSDFPSSASDAGYRSQSRFARLSARQLPQMSFPFAEPAGTSRRALACGVTITLPASDWEQTAAIGPATRHGARFGGNKGETKVTATKSSILPGSVSTPAIGIANVLWLAEASFSTCFRAPHCRKSRGSTVDGREPEVRIADCGLADG